MAWVYILSGVSQRFYIGSTENLNRRIAEHQRGGCHTTKRFGGDVELVVAARVVSMSKARELEVTLKRKKNPRIAISILKSLAN